MKKQMIWTSVLMMAFLTGCQKPSVSSSGSNHIISTIPSIASGANSSNNAGSDITEDITDSYVEPDLKDFEEDFLSQTEGDLSGFTNIDISEKTGTYLIADGGTYVLSGKSSSFSVNVSSDEDVILILNGAEFSSNDGPAIQVTKAKSFVLKLASHTKNVLSDSVSNTMDGIIQVKKCSLEMTGTGYLYLSSNGLSNGEVESGNGIYCSKELSVLGCHISIDANDHAINGKEGVTLKDCQLKLDAVGDGIHSKSGGVSIQNSIIESESYGDGIDVATTVDIRSSSLYTRTYGEFVLYERSKDTDLTLYEDSRYVRDGDSYKKISKDDMSRYQTRYYLKSKCKGMKSDGEIRIESSVLNIVSTDDAIASDGEIDILSSQLSIKTLDQGINSETVVSIGEEGTQTYHEDSYIKIYSSFEGIQGADIRFYDGYTYVVANDDGINASSDDSTVVPSILVSDQAHLVINALGDGIDSNGTISMDGGTMVVFGPSDGGNGSLDFDRSFSLTGGNLFAFSVPGMVELPSNRQNLVSANLSQAFALGDIITLSGDSVSFSFKLPKAYPSLSFIASSGDIETGKTYEIKKGGTNANGFINGVSLDSSISQAESLHSFTVSSLVTTIGNQQQGPGGGNRPGPRWSL